MQPEPGGAVIIASLGKRSVKVRLFESQTMVTAPGIPSKVLGMKVPVFLHKGQPIILAEAVAGVLGMKVQHVKVEKTQTIALTLPKAWRKVIALRTGKGYS